MTFVSVLRFSERNTFQTLSWTVLNAFVKERADENYGKPKKYMGADKTFWICIGIMIVGLLVTVAIFVPLMAKFGMNIILFKKYFTSNNKCFLL